MVAVGECGERNIGNSMVVDPLGVAIARAAEAPALVFAELDKDRLAHARKVFTGAGKPPLWFTRNCVRTDFAAGPSTAATDFMQYRALTRECVCFINKRLKLFLIAIEKT